MKSRVTLAAMSPVSLLLGLGRVKEGDAPSLHPIVGPGGLQLSRGMEPVPRGRGMLPPGSQARVLSHPEHGGVCHKAIME